MRIIKPSRLRAFWLKNRTAEKELRIWIRIVEGASWKSPAEVKAKFGSRVDFGKVASKNTVGVFDIANNNYRLIAAIHYDYQRVFILRVFDHREYDDEKWKDDL